MSASGGEAAMISNDAEEISTIDIYYDTHEHLGSGTYGKVYKCSSKDDGTFYAMKCIDKKRKSNKEGTALPQLMNEIRIMSKLNHENIVRIKAVLETRANIYIIMELCEYGELSTAFVKREGGTIEPFTEAQVRQTMFCLLSALAYLHKLNIAHRDVKPDNILRSSPDFSQLKLSDFGLSKHMGAEHVMEASCGTPHYIAPEVLGDAPSYDEKCDVWSAGVIMYLMLTGRHPFQGKSVNDIYKSVREGLQGFPEDIELSLGAKHLIRHLLKSDPRDRYTAEQALESPWVRGEDKIAAPATLAEMMDLLSARKNFRRLAFTVLATEILMKLSNYPKVDPALTLKSSSSTSSLAGSGGTSSGGGGGSGSLAEGGGRPPRGGSASQPKKTMLVLGTGATLSADTRPARRVSEPPPPNWADVDSAREDSGSGSGGGSQPNSGRGSSANKNRASLLGVSGLPPLATTSTSSSGPSTAPGPSSSSSSSGGHVRRASSSGGPVPSYMKGTAASAARASPSIPEVPIKDIAKGKNRRLSTQDG